MHCKLTRSFNNATLIIRCMLPQANSELVFIWTRANCKISISIIKDASTFTMFAKLQLFPVFKIINSCIYRYYKSPITTCAFIPIHATKVAVKQINLNKWNSILLLLQHRLRAFISNQFIVSMSDILLYTNWYTLLHGLDK